MADATVTAGRGVIYIAIAKVYFMIAGYAIVFSLPRFLGDVASWGEYTVVIALASVIDNVIVTGTIQGVSRFTAQSDALADGVKRAALKVQLVLGGGVALTYFIAAPWIAAWEKDPALEPLYRLSAGIVFCYAFYAVFVGSLNGLRRFGRQATLDVLFATLRAAMILGSAAAGFGALGAVGGFVAAASMILIVSAGWVGLPRRSAASFEAKTIWRFMVQLFVYNIALNLILRTDLFLLKRFAVRLATEGADAAKVASTAAGYYSSAQYLAFIPYQAILAVAFVIFPLVSRSTFQDDVETTRGYIRQTLRLSLIFVGALAVALMANPAALMNVPFRADYRVAGEAMRMLAGGMIAFSMFTIINTILNGAGHTKDTIAIGLLTLTCTVLANWIAIPGAASQAEMLSRAAMATAGSMTLGAIVATLRLYQRYRAAFLPLSVLRVAGALVVALAVGRAIPEVSKIVTLGESAAVSTLYFLVLLVSGEFSKADVQKLKRVFGASKK